MELLKIELADFGNLFRRDPSKLADQEVLALDFILHRAWKVKRDGGRVHFGDKSWSFEDLINLHAFVMREMSERAFQHVFDDELSEKTQPFLQGEEPGVAKAHDLAPVLPSGVELGEEITLEEVLPYFKSFKLRKPYVMLVGGLVTRGRTKGDIDILVKETQGLPHEMRKVLEWRILRALPEKYRSRVSFNYDLFHGPITDFVELYDLTFERVNPENEVKRMGMPGPSAGGDSEEIVKFHNAGVLVAVVLKKNETKTPGVFNYVYGIDFQNMKVPPDTIKSVDSQMYHEVGKTFSTALDLDPGDAITVEFETLNVTRDRKAGTVAVTAFAPRVLGLATKARPMTIGEAVKEARKNFVLQEKEIDEQGETVFKGIRQAFGSYAGKKALAGKICSYIPYHKTYVEPFAGGAAVFWRKDPSPQEVLNDRDPEIAFMYRFIRDHSLEDRQALARREGSVPPSVGWTPCPRFASAWPRSGCSVGTGRK